MTRTRLSPLGLVIGQSSVSFVQLAGSADQLELRSAAHCLLPPLDGESPEASDAAVTDILRTVVSDHRLRGRSVVSCLRSDELIIENIRLPQLPPDEIAKAIQWEATERLPIPLAEAEVRHLVAGDVRQDNVVKQEVILIACPRELIHRRLRVLEGAGLKPIGLDIEPCASLRGLHRAQAVTETSRIAYLQCGESSSTLMFTEGTRILFLKSIPMGGRQFDAAAAQTLAVDPGMAAQMRSDVFAARALDGEDEVHRSIIESLRPCFESLIEEMELCLRYHKVTFRGRPLEGLVMSGSESAPWLAEYFGERIGLKSRAITALDGLSGTDNPSIQYRPGRWTAALGLALKRMN